MRDITISNRQLMNIFKCACEGGIRYSSKTDTIVLVVNNTNAVRPNVWQGNVLSFAGRLEKTPGKLTGANKRLREFLENGKNIYLFEVNEPGKYEYCGKASLNEPATVERLATGEEYPVYSLLVDPDSPLPEAI